MGGTDFPVWLDLGSYGGLACSLLVLGGLATYALGLRRGTPRQLARATLLCLSGSALSLVAIWWKQGRFDLYGPELDPREVLVMLVWSAGSGWFLPLYALVRYIAHARPLPPGQSFTLRVRAVPAAALAALDDPARRVEPLGAGRAWGQLVPLQGELALRPLPLTRKLSLLGREIDNDVIIDDERASRHHAEIHWDHGHPQLRDRASLNGLSLNGQAVRGAVPLRAGDVIEVGAHRFRFEMVDSPAKVDTPAKMADALEATQKTTASGVPGSARAIPGVVLVGLDRGFERTRWELREQLSVIGRDPECQVRLADSSVSRRHAQIVRQPTGYFVSDLQSSNGTAVNGVPLDAPAVLRTGDLVRVGEVTLRCEALTVLPIDPSAPTISLEPSTNGHASGGDVHAASLPTAPPLPAAVGPLTSVMQAITGRPSGKQPNSPRLIPARLRPSRPGEQQDQ